MHTLTFDLLTMCIRENLIIGHLECLSMGLACLDYKYVSLSCERISVDIACWKTRLWKYFIRDFIHV